MSSVDTIRVMLVDDHPIMRRGLQDVLEDFGAFEVVAQAADGVEAVTTAEETQPDVIVMDVMMPGKDGVEACRDILELFQAHTAPVLGPERSSYLPTMTPQARRSPVSDSSSQ